MYDISQFKPALYVLLLIGIAGYGLAAESPGVAVFGATGILLNGWLVHTRRFVPMPRLIANLVTIVSVLYVAREMIEPHTPTPVMIIGKFLVLLQLIKLWEQRANRDYAQLLVLSLLLMVAASINTASMVFGVLMVLYMFLSLYCCLLFHLKIESDRARAAFSLPGGKINSATLRQDKRYLTRSMRRLTAFVSGISIVAAVVVFIVFPRGAGAGMFGPLQLRPSQTLTGFSENVSFQQLAKITQNNEAVAWVSVEKNGVPLQGTEPLLLRGVTLDFYNERPLTGGAWQWMRAQLLEKPIVAEHSKSTELSDDFGATDRYVQHITLNPTGTRALFAIAGPVSVNPRRDLKLKITPGDGVVQTEEPLNQPIDYEIVSTNVLPPDSIYDATSRKRRLESGRKQIDPKVLEYALRPDVSGVNAEGAPLAAQRPLEERMTALDEQIATNIDDHLKANFTYTLDLTDAAKLRRNEDPMVAFLYDLRRGHCEYFAGAMALMCQSLGMQARVVNGFKCDEYNELGGYYIVRQSHAHSWVEVLTAGGWKTFDPTTSRESGVADGGWWEDVKHLFDYLEFSYGNAVIAYDNDHRDNLIASFESKMTNTSFAGADWLTKMRGWFELNVYQLSSTVIGGVMVLMVTFMVFMVLWFVWERWMLRRRAKRIGLESLPVSDKLRLARQLGFYDDLMQLLARHQIVRPKHLTPMEFSQSLLFLPNQAFETICRLTNVFYRVRYGQAELSQGLRRRLSTVIAQLGENLATPRRN
jgi:transglutaminase-like putative cysteine protease